MQGHDPDHDDEGTPDEGSPLPSSGRTSPEQPEPGGFAIPPDPYGTSGGEGSQSGAGRPAWGAASHQSAPPFQGRGSHGTSREPFEPPRGRETPPAEPNAPTEAFGTVPRSSSPTSSPGDEPAAPYEQSASSGDWGTDGAPGRPSPSPQAPPPPSGESRANTEQLHSARTPPEHGWPPHAPRNDDTELRVGQDPRDQGGHGQFPAPPHEQPPWAARGQQQPPSPFAQGPGDAPPPPGAEPPAQRGGSPYGGSPQYGNDHAPPGGGPHGPGPQAAPHPSTAAGPYAPSPTSAGAGPYGPAGAGPAGAAGARPTPDGGASGAYQQPQASWYDLSDLYPGRSKGAGKRGLMIASAIIGVFVVLGGSAYAYITFSGGTAPSESGPVAASTTTPARTQAAEQAKTTSPPPPPPSFDPAQIRNAKVDPKPLALGEAFPQKHIKVRGHKLDRVATNMTKKCGKSAQPGFEKALRKAGCKRVLRATYTNGKYAVTAGVAVLPNRADAAKVERAANPKKKIWFAPLRGPKGSGAEKIHRSGGYSAIKSMGHYVAFSFAAYTDRKKPPPKAQDLSDLCAAMREEATEAIRSRGMVTPPASPR